MGDFPRITRPASGLLTVPVQSSWRDHHVQERPVLPAVEAMQILAGQVRTDRPRVDVLNIGGARFPKLLAIDPGHDTVDIRCEIADHEDGGVQVSLASTAIVGAARIRRSVTHADVRFGGTVDPPVPLPLDLMAAIEGVCTLVDPEAIYRELVPFGPGFRSICQPLAISPDGALARVRAPEGAGAHPGPLGSGFPLDGAFHAACVWGQRYTRRVAFPVAITQRRILIPTRGEATYTARVVPIAVDTAQLTVDIWILDENGNLCEAALGVAMRDVSRGAWQPPAWIIDDRPTPDLFPWTDDGCGMVLLERSPIADFARAALSNAEAQRLVPMGPQRRQGYIGGRLALKRLWRKLAGNDHRQPPTAIETVAGDGNRPSLPAVGETAPVHCALAHDERFCVAAAHDAPVGIDVEPISDRVLPSAHLFMAMREQSLVRTATMGQAEAALRVWSIKEAASKAMDISLADAWKRITVVDIGKRESRYENNGGQRFTARHAVVEGHLITLVGIAGSNRI